MVSKGLKRHSQSWVWWPFSTNSQAPFSTGLVPTLPQNGSELEEAPEGQAGGQGGSSSALVPPATPSGCICPGTPSWQCFNWLFSPDYLFQTGGEDLLFFVTFLSNILLVPLSLQHPQRLRLLSQKSQKTALLIVILSILLLGQQAQKQPSALKGKEKGAVPKGRRTILFCHFPIWLGSKLKF